MNRYQISVSAGKAIPVTQIELNRFLLILTLLVFAPDTLIAMDIQFGSMMRTWQLLTESRLSVQPSSFAW
jgi:hypothetical protein